MGGQEKLLSLKEEVKSYQFWKAVRCEFLITLLYVFVGESHGGTSLIALHPSFILLFDIFTNTHSWQ